MNSVNQELIEGAGRIFGGLKDRFTGHGASSEFDRSAWDELASYGLTRVALPAAQGGSEAGLPDIMALARLVAYHAIPLPLVETWLVQHVVAPTGLLLPSGPLSLAPRAVGKARGAGARDLLECENGVGKAIAWGAGAAEILTFLVDTGGVERLVLMPPQGVARHAANLAGEPRDDVRFDGAPARPVGSGLALTQLRLLLALARTHMMVGAIDRCLELTISHAKDRVQFGRPIARFQAVQQMIAVSASQATAACSAAQAAVSTLSSHRADFEIACAKIRVGEAAHLVAAVAHQVHGAMGFTLEHPLHLSSLRLWSWRDEGGTEVEWAREVGRMAAKLGGDGLWRLLCEGSAAAFESMEEGIQVAV